MLAVLPYLYSLESTNFGVAFQKLIASLIKRNYTDIHFPYLPVNILFTVPQNTV
jgi:hypothetical protein